jgi:exopolyphosphatase/guanosine-5'-triphosphate,3'-diphosphate pyrophosphatase
MFEAMVTDVIPMLDDFPEKDALKAACSRLHMLGTSGTVTTLAGVHMELPRYDRRRVDGAWMTSAEIDVVIAQLRAMPYEERVANPCIGRERADLVLAGCAILEAFRRTFPCTRLRVADRGLREGMLIDLMRADGVWRGPRYRS